MAMSNKSPHPLSWTYRRWQVLLATQRLRIYVLSQSISEPSDADGRRHAESEVGVIFDETHGFSVQNAAQEGLLGKVRRNIEEGKCCYLFDGTFIVWWAIQMCVPTHNSDVGPHT